MDEVSKNFYFNNNLSKPINRNITDTHVVFQILNQIYIISNFIYHKNKANFRQIFYGVIDTSKKIISLRSLNNQKLKNLPKNLKTLIIHDCYNLDFTDLKFENLEIYDVVNKKMKLLNI